MVRTYILKTILSFLKLKFREKMEFPDNVLLPPSCISDFEQAFIQAVETVFPYTKIRLCSVHPQTNVQMNMIKYNGGQSIEAGSELEELILIWAGATYLNIDTHAGHDVLIKNHLLELASRKLTEEGFTKFEIYLNKYFTREGVYSLSRYIPYRFYRRKYCVGRKLCRLNLKWGI